MEIVIEIFGRNEIPERKHIEEKERSSFEIFSVWVREDKLDKEFE